MEWIREERKMAAIKSPSCSVGISFDARDLHPTTYGGTGQAEIVLEPHLRCVRHLSAGSILTVGLPRRQP